MADKRPRVNPSEYMKEYTGFAEVYDMFMDNVPYDEWTEYLHGLLKDNGVKEGIVLELGCGTGNVTRRLCGLGYDMIGVDLSPEMLQIAMEKPAPKGKDILYLCQDMREFELYGSVAAVVSICDSMNYITEAEELLSVFRLVNNYLDPGGVFIFDMNTEYYYKYVLGEQTICENRDEGSFIWENFYDGETCINEFDMTIYVKGRGDSYRRFEETHYQKAYKIGEVRGLLEKAGLKDVRVYKCLTAEKPTRNTERVYFTARKRG